MIHVALLDDHPAVLAGLRRLVEPEPDQRTDSSEIAWRGQRVVGRLRPRARTRSEELAIEAGGAATSATRAR